MKNQKGFIQIPLLIAIIAGVLVIGVGGYIIGTKQYQNNLVGNSEKEKQTQELTTNQQTNTESIAKTNDTQSGDLISPKIGKTAPTQETTITPSPKTASSIRYISQNTTLYTLTVNQSGATNLAFIKTLYKGTQVTFKNDVYKDWSKIIADNQEGWVFSSDIVSNEPSASKLSDIIKKWRPIVAYVECDFRDINTNQLYSQVRGSGVVIDFDSQITIITNRHVIIDSNGYQPYSCRIKLPNDSNTFIGQKFTGGGSIDIGLIDINNPNEYIKSLTAVSTSPLNFCKQKPSLGDEVIILGYPSIGSQTDITATEGIISGYDGDYFITSAKVEQGNSGGAAILVRGDCYLGIPSFAKSGSVESLSRILDINAAMR